MRCIANGRSSRAASRKTSLTMRSVLLLLICLASVNLLMAQAPEEATPIVDISPSSTAIPTLTPTDIPTLPFTATNTEAPTEAPSDTFTPSPEMTVIPVASDTPTLPFTATDTETPTEAPSDTLTPPPEMTEVSTASNTPTDIATAVASMTITNTVPPPTVIVMMTVESFASPSPTVDVPTAPSPPTIITGIVQLQYPYGTNADTRVVLIQNDYIVSETLTAGDGSFTLANIPAGDFRLEVAHSGYLPLSITLHVSDNQSVSLSPMTLQAGDVNGDNLIDQRDLATLEQVYGLLASNVPLGADLNHDGVIDLMDLQMLAANLGL